MPLKGTSVPLRVCRFTPICDKGLGCLQYSQRAPHRGGVLFLSAPVVLSTEVSPDFYSLADGQKQGITLDQ